MEKKSQKKRKYDSKLRRERYLKDRANVLIWARDYYQDTKEERKKKVKEYRDLNIDSIRVKDRLRKRIQRAKQKNMILQEKDSVSKRDR